MNAPWKWRGAGSGHPRSGLFGVFCVLAGFPLVGLLAGLLISLGPLLVPPLYVGTIPLAGYTYLLVPGAVVLALIGIVAVGGLGDRVVRDRAVFFLLVASIFSDRAGIGFATLGLMGTGIALTVWVSRGLAAGRITVVPSPLYLPTLALVGCMTFSLLSTVEPLGSKLSGLIHFAVFRAGYTFFLINTLRTRLNLRLVLDYVLICCLLSRIFLVVQVLGFVLFDTLILMAVAEGGFVSETSWWDLPRFSALSEDPNRLSGLLFLGGTVAAMEALDVELEISKGRRAWLLVTAMLSLAGIILMAAKAATAAVVMMWGLILLAKRPALGMRVACFGIVAAAVTVSFADLLWLKDLALTARLSLGDERGDLVILAIEAVRRFPLTGTGIGSFQWNNPFALPVHNSFLQVASEVGLPGMAIFIWLLGGFGKRLVAAIRKETDRPSRNLLKTLAWTYLGFLPFHLFHPFATSKVLWLYLGLAEAAVLLAVRGEDWRASPRFG
jgi:O-antigen ligase